MTVLVLETGVGPAKMATALEWLLAEPKLENLPYRPKLLVLDEPFSGLDPLVRDEFMEGLLNQAGEMTVLLSSHELGEIDGVATHVAFLDEGKLLFQESMSALMGRFREVHVTLEQAAMAPREIFTSCRRDMGRDF